MLPELDYLQLGYSQELQRWQHFGPFAQACPSRDANEPFPVVIVVVFGPSWSVIAQLDVPSDADVHVHAENLAELVGRAGRGDGLLASTVGGVEMEAWHS